MFSFSKFIKLARSSKLFYSSLLRLLTRHFNIVLDKPASTHGLLDVFLLAEQGLPPGDGIDPIEAVLIEKEIYWRETLKSWEEGKFKLDCLSDGPKLDTIDQLISFLQETLELPDLFILYKSQYQSHYQFQTDPRAEQELKRFIAVLREVLGRLDLSKLRDEQKKVLLEMTTTWESFQAGFHFPIQAPYPQWEETLKINEAWMQVLQSQESVRFQYTLKQNFLLFQVGMDRFSEQRCLIP